MAGNRKHKEQTPEPELGGPGVGTAGWGRPDLSGCLRGRGLPVAASTSLCWDHGTFPAVHPAGVCWWVGQDSQLGGEGGMWRGYSSFLDWSSALIPTVPVPTVPTLLSPPGASSSGQVPRMLASARELWAVTLGSVPLVSREDGQLETQTPGPAERTPGAL